MRSLIRLSVACGAVALLVCGVAAGQEPANRNPTPKPAQKVEGGKHEGPEDWKMQPVKPNAALEKLKSLAGEWCEKDDMETAAKEKRAPMVAVTYHVTGDGSAVCETLFPGQPHEMISMYHADGEGMMMTHYCAGHNQPQMKTAKPADPNHMEFKFAGGTNIDPAKDSHMHEMKITIVDANHIRTEWTSWSDGKAGGTKAFDLVRKSDGKADTKTQ